MSPNTQHSSEGEESSFGALSRPEDLAALARELVERVGIEGAKRYCHGLGWLGVLDEVNRLDRRH